MTRSGKVSVIGSGFYGSTTAQLLVTTTQPPTAGVLLAPLLGLLYLLRAHLPAPGRP